MHPSVHHISKLVLRIAYHHPFLQAQLHAMHIPELAAKSYNSPDQPITGQKCKPLGCTMHLCTRYHHRNQVLTLAPATKHFTSFRRLIARALKLGLQRSCTVLLRTSTTAPSTQYSHSLPLNIPPSASPLHTYTPRPGLPKTNPPQIPLLNHKETPPTQNGKFIKVSNLANLYF